MDPEDSFKISVTVQSPELKVELGGASKYYVYHIHGQDKFAQFSVYRRYSDFIILKQSMMARWPGVYVPPLPQKKFIGNNDVQFVDYRRHGLQQFLGMIAKVQFLWNADEFQLFIKNNATDVEKSLGNLGKTNFKEISIKYERVFSQKFQQKEGEQKLQFKILEFKSYLKNAQLLLQKMGKVAQSMTETRKKFQDKYILLLQTFLPDYQQKCVSQYLQSQDEVSWHLYFAKTSTKNLSENARQLSQTFGSTGHSQNAQLQKNLVYKHNALSYVNELIKQQIRQLGNFNEIIALKQSYDSMKHRSISKVKDLELEQSKITAGKQSIVSKLKNQNKEEQLRNNKSLLQKSRSEQQQVQKVCRLIEIVLVHYQIQRFKKWRVQNYYKVVKLIATAQKNMYEIEGDLWNKIAGFEGEMGLQSPLKYQDDRKQKVIMKQIKVNQNKQLDKPQKAAEDEKKAVDNHVESSQKLIKQEQSLVNNQQQINNQQVDEKNVQEQNSQNQKEQQLSD